MSHCWKSTDTDDLISTSLRESSSMGPCIRQEKCAHPKLCLLFLHPFSLLLIERETGSALCPAPHPLHPNYPGCLGVPKQVRARAALWPLSVLLRSSLHARSQGPTPISFLLWDTSKAFSISFLVIFPTVFCLFVSFSAFQVLLCSLIAPEARQMD